MIKQKALNTVMNTIDAKQRDDIFVINALYDILYDLLEYSMPFSLPSCVILFYQPIGELREDCKSNGILKPLIAGVQKFGPEKDYTLKVFKILESVSRVRLSIRFITFFSVSNFIYLIPIVVHHS